MFLKTLMKKVTWEFVTITKTLSAHTFPVIKTLYMTFLNSLKVLGMKAIGFTYTLPSSKLRNAVDTRPFINNIDLEISWKLYKFVNVKVLNIKGYNAAEETQIRDTDLMVRTQSWLLCSLIDKRYWKKLVMKTGIWTSFNTIKNA